MDGRQYGEALPQVAVQTGVSDLVLQDRVGPAQDLQPLRRNIPYYPDGESRPRERLAPHHPLGHPELRRHDPHLILEEVAQRLDEVEVHHLRQPSDVVVALYPCGVTGPALDNVAI